LSRGADSIAIACFTKQFRGQICAVGGGLTLVTTLQ